MVYILNIPYKLECILRMLTFAFQFYIGRSQQERCVKVKAGDRIGLYIEASPSAIAYTFHRDMPKVLYRPPSEVPTLIAVNDVVEFYAIRFPYGHSIMAYVDTDISLYNLSVDDWVDQNGCPNGLVIPR